MLLNATYSARIERARDIIEQIESDARGRFYGLENVTAKGIRVWSLASVAPHTAIDAIKGVQAPPPRHILKRFDAQKHAWRSIDLSTIRRVWHTRRDGKRIEYVFA
jgi:hypothetical protein